MKKLREIFSFQVVSWKRGLVCPWPAALLAALLVLSLGGCTLRVKIVFEGIPTFAPPGAPAPRESGQVDPASLASCLPSGKEVERARVTRVVDGDTIHVDMDGKDYTVRYIGIDTPETVAPNTPVEYYGPEASRRNTELVDGKEVLMARDTSEVDRNGRLLRYIFVEGEFINETLVREGFATARAYPPDTACTDPLARAQQEAQQARRGMWQDGAAAVTEAASGGAGPAAVPAATLAPGAAGSCPRGCAEEQPGCAIKGNINSAGDKIYHLPGGGSYAGTKIDPSKGERWFCSEEEARQNGWRAPGK